MNQQAKPKDITIRREDGVLQITWLDGTESDYPLTWLRANCPCATCREVRGQAAASTDMLSLNTGATLDPSTEVAGAELVGNYAIRIEWTDGHGSGIYGFSNLRACSEVEKLKPSGQPHLNFRFA